MVFEPVSCTGTEERLEPTFHEAGIVRVEHRKSPNRVFPDSSESIKVAKEKIRFRQRVTDDDDIFGALQFFSGLPPKPG